MPTTNRYRPTVLSFNSYGWRGSPQYNRADVPTRWVEGATSLDRTVLEQQMAYEWLNSEPSGKNPMGGWGMATNPPFTTGSAGRLIPGQPRIMRGFIRRSEYDASDPASMARLYFMFNPETITRDYVSYLDQGALDPFNTIYESGNLVAPPSVMDFTFSLLFDRQEESMQPDYPGVYVDYKFFDLVVRNVIPSTDAQTNTGLPDNGVMMVNPRDITVVFSPEMTVQGRPSNARVQFTKFTHRMVPVRMQIDLTIRVTYFGPMKDPIAYAREADVQAASIPWREDMGAVYEITNDDIEQWQLDQQSWARGVTDAFLAAIPEGAATSIQDQWQHSQGGSTTINAAIMEYAAAQVKAAGSEYGYDSGRRGNLWKVHECSTFIWGGFAYYGNGAYKPSYVEDMKWGKPNYGSDGKIDPSHSNCNNSIEQLKLCLNGTSPVTRIFGTKEAATSGVDVRRAEVQRGFADMLPGDLIFRDINIGPNTQESHEKGHIAWFHHWDRGPGSDIWLCHSGSKKKPAGVPGVIPKEYLFTDYNYAFRPNLVGKNMSANYSDKNTPV